MDGLTMGYFARELSELLTGGRVERVAQPEKDMLLLTVRSGGVNHKLLLSASPSLPRAQLTARQYENPQEAPLFCMLLRKRLVGGHVMAIAQPGGDRVLTIRIDALDDLGEERSMELWLEAMGRHSNLTLVENGKILDAIRHVTFDMSRVRQALPGLPFLPPPAQDRLDPLRADESAVKARFLGKAGRLDKLLSENLCGLSADTARELSFRLTGMTGAQVEFDQALCDKCASLLARLPALAAPTLLIDEQGAPCALLPFPFLSLNPELQKRKPSLTALADDFYFGKDLRDRMQARSQSLRKTIKTILERDEKKLALQEEELRQGEKMDEYRRAGEMLNAFLYQVHSGAQRVSLPDFATGAPVEIELDPRLSPAQNAQKYFKRYQKAKAAAHMAREQAEKTRAEIAFLQEAQQGAENAQDERDLRDVRDSLVSQNLLRRPSSRDKQKRPQESAPRIFRSPDGLVILVGKNAPQNERILKAAAGTDLWLHAKDVPGSHVIVCAEGRPVPEATLACALRLAAFFSASRGISVNVECTLRRYVKKPAGTPPGFVTYTNQRAYIISVQEKEIREIAEG